jgi:hypothetical protein
MAYASSATPILHPIITETYSKLVAAPITTKPSEGGYTLGFPGTREVSTQQELIKLFYARHFDASSTELAISIGTSVQLSEDRAAYRKSKKSLSQIWKGLRSRAFGAKSPLSLLVQHKVEQFDFLATLTELFRMEIVSNRVPIGGETYSARQVRLSMAAKYASRKDEHIGRMDRSMADAVTDATRGLNLARLGAYNAMRSSRIREARSILEFREREKSVWESELARLRTWTNPNGHSPAEKTYSYLPSDCQQAFWERIWSKDVGVMMLSGLENVIDIPATLEHSETMYKALFIVYAMDTWKYCCGVEFGNRVADNALRAAGIPGGIIEMSGEAMRSQVYANMSEASRRFFDDAPGKELDRLRVACDASEGRSKRKRVEPTFIPNLYILAKKRRT